MDKFLEDDHDGVSAMSHPLLTLLCCIHIGYYGGRDIMQVHIETAHLVLTLCDRPGGGISGGTPEYATRHDMKRLLGDMLTH